MCCTLNGGDGFCLSWFVIPETHREKRGFVEASLAATSCRSDFDKLQQKFPPLCCRQKHEKGFTVCGLAWHPSGEQIAYTDTEGCLGLLDGLGFSTPDSTATKVETHRWGRQIFAPDFFFFHLFVIITLISGLSAGAANQSNQRLRRPVRR